MGRRVDLTGQRFGKLVVVSVGRKNGAMAWKCKCDCGGYTELESNKLTSGNTKSCGCMRRRDLSGQSFGKLVVLGLSDVRKTNHRVWRCQCSCGNYTDVITKSLTSGNTKSCGCGLSNPSDITGQRFGKLTTIRPTEKRINKCVVWECLCDCGNRIEVITNSLTTGNTKSCGCLKYDDLTGKRFGKLVVLNEAEKIGMSGKSRWDCLCDCGKQTTVFSTALKSGNTKSCGCFNLAILRSKVGNKNPNYNPNLTDEERLSYRYQLGGNNFRKWSKQIMERDNYTCQICNQHSGKLNAHHLNGWNAFPEQRFDLDNGVTLCTDCHKDFHSQYGYGDNTREQFDEYAVSKTLILN